MYYLLFETGDTLFFEQNIAEAFCSIIAQSIISLYKSGAFNEKSKIVLDNNNMKENFEKNGQSFYFLNCQLFSGIHCGNTGCKAKHKAVLARDQLDAFERVMKKKKDAFLRARTSNARDRLNAQVIFQNYAVANNQQLEIISFENQSNHNDYLNLFVKNTNKLNNKSDADGFVYVRATTGASDYSFFENATSLPNLTPCDSFNDNGNTA
jgi:hypothetical protein